MYNILKGFVVALGVVGLFLVGWGGWGGKKESGKMDSDRVFFGAIFLLGGIILGLALYYIKPKT